MKKMLLLLLSFSVFIQSSIAQQLHVNHTLLIGGSGGEKGQFAIATKDGGILFVGATTSSASGGGDIPNSADGITRHIYVGKMDSNSNIIWTKVFGGTFFDYANSACETSDGGYGILATVQSNDGDVTSNHGLFDIWLLKIDSIGNLKWQKTFGSSSGDNAISVASTNDHGFIILGGSNGDDGDIPFHYGGVFSTDWIVIKTDSIGNKQWLKVMGTSNNESGNGSIFAANSGYYFVSGATTSDHDCTDNSWHTTANTGADVYLFKLDLNGNIEWGHSYGGTGGEDANYCFWDDRDSSIMIVGTTNSVDYMVTGYHGGGGDAWVIKTDKDGVLKWQSCLGYNFSDDQGISITKATDKGYMVSATTFDGPQPPHVGQQDALVFRIDSVGHVLADKIFGSILYEWTGSIVPIKGRYAVYGFTNDTAIAFTEGTCSAFHGSQENFMTFLDYWPLLQPSIEVPQSLISTYPNPVTDVLHVATTEPQHYVLHNLMGVAVLQGTVSKNNSIDMKAISTGTYLLQLTNNAGQKAVVRVVKE